MTNLEPMVITFKINSVDMPTPTDILWVLPKVWGVNGQGLEQLEPYGSVVLTWDYMDFDQYTILRDAYDSITGTAQVYLPTFYGDILTHAAKTVIVNMPRPERPGFQNRHATVKMTLTKVQIGRATAGP